MPSFPLATARAPDSDIKSFVTVGLFLTGIKLRDTITGFVFLIREF